MAFILPQIRTGLSQDEKSVVAKALKTAGLSSGDISFAGIYRTSLDARRQGNMTFVHSVIVTLKDAEKERSFAQSRGYRLLSEGSLNVIKGSEKQSGRPVIAGFGPAGMFCALVLAENGYRPVVLERGSDADTRAQKVLRFWKTGELDENTNVQFGEGGAGTFSDGKLVTRTKDPLCGYVLRQFVRFGAPDEILVKAKPHIGTDKLRKTVKAIREHIISLGGEVRFNTKLTGLKLSGGRLTGVYTDSGEMAAGSLVAAVGHSARDTFEMLLNSGTAMESKPFAVGARIEHPQSAVDESLYGAYRHNPLLPKGEYQMSYTRKDGQSCYTFCMCPGGTVVAAASESGGVVTNGMSEFARDGSSANSAVVVAVNRNDYGTGILDGVSFAREIERRAYLPQKPYYAPSQTVGEFLEGRSSRGSSFPASLSSGYLPGTYHTELDSILPARVCSMMREGLGVFAGRMKCFGDRGAVLTAPETRTSSPVRILRTPEMNSPGIDNLYPCGEGAGYAGGITSSAVDGVKAALRIMSRFAEQ